MHASTLLLLVLAPLGSTAQRLKVSKDATCGGSKGYTCLGSTWGDCCSQYGWCGSTTAYCGTGCNSKFGTCTNSIKSSTLSTVVSATRRTTSSSRTSATAATPVATQRVSSDARCGPSFGGRTCLGSQWGDCCSQYSYCGSTNAYCTPQICQKGYGKCDTISSSSKLGQSSTRGSSSLSSSASKSSSSSSSKTLTSTLSALVSTSSHASISSTSSDVSQTSATQSSSSSESAFFSSSGSLSIVTTSTTSPTTSLSASPEPTCFSVPGCTPATGSLFECNASINQCKNGFQSKCGQLPSTGSVTLSVTPSLPDGYSNCLDLCARESKCVGFGNNLFPNAAGQLAWSCTLFSKITGVSQGWGTSFLKVCDDASSSSSISLSSTTLSSASSSIEISSSLSVSSSASLPSTTTPSIASTTVESTSSSAVSFNTISAASSASPSASPPASDCPYSSAPGCTPAASLNFDGCPTSDDNCISGYQFKCGQEVNLATLADDSTIHPGSIDECASRCDANPICYAFTYSYVSTYYQMACTYFGPNLELAPVQGRQDDPYVTYLKLCPDVAPAISSISSISIANPSITTSLVFNSSPSLSVLLSSSVSSPTPSTIVSLSSSASSSTSTPGTTPVTRSCVDGPINGYNYITQCNVRCNYGSAILASLTRPDFQSCVAFCDDLIGTPTSFDYNPVSLVCNCNNENLAQNEDPDWDCALRSAD